MKIAIFSINYYPDLTGAGYYSGVLAEELVARGHCVTVFAAPPFYPEWKCRPGYRYWFWSKQNVNGVTVYRCPTFIPKNLSVITRILHYGSFALSAMIATLYTAVRESPNLVMNITPTLFSAIPALFLARIKRTTSWLHVQDFEAEAGIATGQMRKSSILAKIAMKFESSMISHFHRTSSISVEMCRKLKEKGSPREHIYEFRNWSDIDNIFPKATSEYRKLWDINTQHVVLFSGSITRKQGIDVLTQTARLMQDRSDVTFVICGSGPGREELELSAKDLKNIQFHALQPHAKLNELLALASIHLLPQKADAADLVLPSKLTNILASGKPVIVGANRETGLAREVEGCGIAIAPENPQALANAIIRLLDDPIEYGLLSKKARERAVKAWHKEVIISNFENEILKTISSPSVLETA